MTNADIEEDDVKNLEDDWSAVVEMTTKEKIFQVDKDYVDDLVEKFCENHSDRLPEEYESIEKKIKTAFEQSFDVDKFNELIPELWYPNDIKETITKQDLLYYIS